MRKIASILLLAILAFNWVGYQLFSDYLQDRADNNFTAAIDENRYNESELVSVKVPASYLSGYVHNNQFERVDGKVTIDGVQYNYVKRRIANDSLEFLCVPNHTATRIQSAKEDFFKLVNDLQHPGQGKKADQHNVSKSFSPELISGLDGLTITHTASSFLRTTTPYLCTLPSPVLAVKGQPPCSFQA